MKEPGKRYDKSHGQRGHDRGSWRRGGGGQRKGADGGAGPEVDESLPVVQMFRAFQVELDDRHDRHERLVKLSRDVTIESKRTIFLLHRIMGEQQKDKTLAEAHGKLSELQNSQLREIATELRDQCPYLYLRAYSPGVQEYVEAVTFYHYIKDGRLVSLEEICQPLVYDEQPEEAESDLAASGEGEAAPGTPPAQLRLEVTPTDYMLGVADLTGELMRKCINAVGQGNLEEPFVLCRFLRDVYSAFLGFGNTAGREASRKVWTLFQSVRKVENACYAIRVRGSEIPSHMLADVFSVSLAKEEGLPECE
ncbi:translin associated factor X, putative [Ixodes scapularis]|uniref:Translin-associated protein X n=1 Tax=Ixodes scapularis TaxID=6945 RepID=B7QCA6_IXOSC|nr:translin associated factor X, putative [Ixodes scapularis]|eukprot:XP_002413170.1 translin associated factor X, putative [Ixodes scapularis]